MNNYLFLDDERVPADVTWIALHQGSYQIARDYRDFTNYIKHYGIPDVISFDNDLGEGEREGIECAHWLVNEVLDGNLAWNPKFQFTVHSKNPVAAERISGLLEPFIAHMGVQ